MLTTRAARLLAVAAASLLLVDLPAATTASAQYGSYRGSKYSGGFGGTAFTSRRQSRFRGNTHLGTLTPYGVAVPGLGYAPTAFGGYVPPVYGGYGYTASPYGYYTQPGFSPFVYSPADYRRFGVRSIGVSPGAIYSPGVSVGLTTRRGRQLGLSLGGFRSTTFATVGAYADPYGGLGYGGFGGPGFGGVTAGGAAYGAFSDPYLLPQPPVTPTESYYTEDAETARRLRQQMRDSETAGLAPDRRAHRAARPTSVEPQFSTPAQKAKSVSLEDRGDRMFGEQNYLRAYSLYKEAVQAAGDRSEPRAKLVMSYAAIGQYDRAVGELKTLLALDPAYPRQFLSLDSMFGDAELTKEQVKTGVAEWTVGHVADPERLLLLAAVTYFDGQADKAAELFESVALYDDLRPLVAGFLNIDRVTIPPAFGEPTPAGAVIPTPNGSLPGDQEPLNPTPAGPPGGQLAPPPLGDLSVPTEPIVVPPLPVQP